MIGVALALLSSLLWGASDFSAGLGARRIDALRTSLWTFLGATVLLGGVLLVGGAAWSGEAVLAGVVAAVCSAAGFVTFYASLALAPMGVATAIVAASEVVVPVLAGVLWKSEALAPIAWLGVVAAAVGAVVVGGAEGKWGGAALRAVLLALFAGAAFGLAVVALDAAPAESGFVAPSIEMAGGLVLVGAMVLAVRRVPRLREAATSVGLIAALPGGDRGGVVFGLIAGLLQGVANLVLMLALWNGQLAVVGAITCLYPITTVLLARTILAERLTRAQLGGISVALAGCVLLALG